ncbi:hypothetical protein B4114_0915 [Geobacillus stearothermophilus]|uniref:Uncharacterized protein n=1 Tax=Geobacillus stearothermophilus TaxID=1422 RepID=A0A150N9B9_GEOSE|nr:hypothetical protein B4114_0915 [Geobacillus stearothermophilus]
MFIAVSKTSKAREMLMMIKTLSSHVGNGMTSMATMSTTIINTDKSLSCACMVFSPCCYPFRLSR